MGVLRTFVLLVVFAGVLVAGTSTAGSASAPKTPIASAPAAAANVASADAEAARIVLERLSSEYRHLDGVVLTFGRTPGNKQAVAYYSEGKIVVSPDHATSIDAILAHEVWHIIDWRDNGQLDWGERLPPVNAYAYRK